MNALSSLWIQYVVAMLWQSSLVILVLFGIYLIARRRSATFCYLLLCVGLLKFCLPPSLNSLIMLGGLHSHMVSSNDNAAFLSNIPFLRNSAVTPRRQLQSATKQAPTANNEIVKNKADVISLVGQMTGNAWFFAWAGVVLTLAVLNAGRMHRLKKHFSQAQRVTDPSLQEAFKECCHAIGIRRAVILETMDNLHSPIAMGIIKPRVLIPRNIIFTLTATELRAVFYHELAHIKRGDIPINAIQVVIAEVWFFHPLLWLLNSLIRRTRERACDDMAISLSQYHPAEYASGLLRTSQLCTAAAYPIPGLIGIADRGPDIMRRIKRVLETQRRFTNKVSFLEFALITLVIALVVPLAAPKTSGANPKGADATSELPVNHPSQVEAAKYPTMAFSCGTGCMNRDSALQAIHKLPPNADSMVFGRMIIEGVTFYCACSKITYRDSIGLPSLGEVVRTEDSSKMRPMANKQVIIDKNHNLDLSDDTPIQLRGLVFGHPDGTRMIMAHAKDSVKVNGKTVRIEVETDFYEGQDQALSFTRSDATQGMLQVFDQSYPIMIYDPSMMADINWTGVVVSLDKKPFREGDTTGRIGRWFDAKGIPVVLPNARFLIAGFSPDNGKVLVKGMQKGRFNYPDLRVGDKAPDFDATALDGRRVSLKNLLSKNDYALLCFANSSYGESKKWHWKRIVANQTILNKHSGRTAAVLFDLSGDFTTMQSSDIPIVHEDMLYDPSPVSIAYGVRSRTNFVLVDKKGVVRWNGQDVPFWSEHPDLGLTDTKALFAEFRDLTK